MKILFNYKPYRKPKRCLMYMTGNEYIKSPETGYYGWERIPVQVDVIGESDTQYVTELKVTRNCDTWDKDYNKKFLMPLGFNKSRIIKWLPMPGEQLKLF